MDQTKPKETPTKPQKPDKQDKRPVKIYPDPVMGPLHGACEAGNSAAEIAIDSRALESVMENRNCM